MNQRLLKDVYAGTNAEKAQWVENKDWSYTSDPFQVSESYLAQDNVELVFESIDTYAEVYFNGVLLFETNNYFREYRFDIKSMIKPEGNTVEVLIKSPIRQGNKQIEASKHPLPGEAIRAVTRKPQFHYGWDWGPKLTTSGIPGGIFIDQWSEYRVEHVGIQTISCNKDRAELQVSLHVESQVNAEINWALNMKSNGEYINAEGRFKLKKGTHTIDFPLTVQNPNLWWPNGYGEAALYACALKLSSDKIASKSSHVFQTGIRTVQLMTDADEFGNEFSFHVNGTPIFMKGANYIPQSIFDAEVAPSDTRRLLNQAKEVHMNMLRVWGGGIYETDYFYDVCDSLGILVWQDFMFACAMYPGDKLFRQNVQEEAKQQVLRLKCHPSMALWCGNNENSEGWHRWGWQTGLTEKEKKKVWKSYKNIFLKDLPKAVESHSNLDYWETSPMLGRGDSLHKFMGDAHYWGVWHDAESFDSLETKVPRFMSEFGFQSFPEPSVMERIAPKARWDSMNVAVRYHEKHPRGFELINTYMKRDYVVPGAFEDWLYLSQLVQRDGMIQGIRAHRAAQPYCMGTLYWQLNDVWPAASWSSIDSEGNWKALHYALKEAYAPRAIWPELRGDSLCIRMVNDLQAINVQVEMTCMSYEGQLLEQIHLTEINLEHGSHYQHFSSFDTPKNAIWILDWSFGEEQHTVTWSPHNSNEFILPKVRPTFKITPKNGSYEIAFRSAKYHKGLRISANANGVWSDNYIDLIPGRIQTVTFTPTAPLSESLQLDFKDVNSTQ